MASGIMFAARSELCIVIWMGFVKLLRSISFLFFIIIFFLGYLGFNVKKFVKGALLSWLGLESMLVACLVNDLLVNLHLLPHPRPHRCSRFEKLFCHSEFCLHLVVSRQVTLSPGEPVLIGMTMPNVRFNSCSEY